MSRVILCDRCGTIIKDNETYFCLDYADIGKDTATADLCTKCKSDFFAFMKPPVPEPEPKPKKRKVTTHYVKKPQTPPDWGKAQALRNARWTITKIADELGVTKSAVYAHTVKPDEKKRVYENEWNEKEPDLDPNTRFIMGEEKEEPDEQG